MRRLFVALIAAATLGAGPAAAFPGEYEIPAFPLPDIASHVAIYGTPDDPKYWEGPDVNNVTQIVFRSHGLIDILFNFKIKNATPGATVELGGNAYLPGSSKIGVVDEDGNFESGWVPSYATVEGYGFNWLRVGELWAGGAAMEQSFDLYDFKVTGTQGPAVPEPATWALMILGFGLVGAAMRRRSFAVASAT